MTIHEEFAAFLESRNVRLLQHQQRLADAFLEWSERDFGTTQFMCGGYGSGRTFTFAQIEAFFDQRRPEAN